MKVVLDSSPLPHKMTPSELFPLRDQEAVAMRFHGTNGSSSSSGGNVALQVSLYDRQIVLLCSQDCEVNFEKKNISLPKLIPNRASSGRVPALAQDIEIEEATDKRPLVPAVSPVVCLEKQ